MKNPVELWIVTYWYGSGSTDTYRTIDLMPTKFVVFKVFFAYYHLNVPVQQSPKIIKNSQNSRNQSFSFFA
jgi:hypothetical protein